MRAMELYDALTRRIQAVMSAVERLSRGLAGSRGRKSILIFSDGFLNDTNQRGFDRAIDASQRGNTAIYFIDAKGLAGQSFYGADQATAPRSGDVGVISMEEAFLETAGTESLAENTGGASIRNTNDLLGGLERVTQESSVYYLLGYQPENSPDGKWHRLEVKVSRPGVKVRARRGYQATPPSALEALQKTHKPSPTERKKGPSKGPTRPLDPAVMTSGAEDTIALRVAPYVLEADPKGLARVLVALEVDTSSVGFEGAGERRRATLDLTILGLSRDQPRLFPIDERMKLDLEGKAAGGWLTLSREVRLPAGVAQVRVLVRDLATGRAGTVAQRLVVPAFDRPYLSTPILTDRIETPRGRSARLVPLAHRRFRPQGGLYCAYEVFGMTDIEGRATTRVAGGYTLQTDGGRVVSAAPPTLIAVDLGGRVVRMLALSLDGLEAGDYELVSRSWMRAPAESSERTSASPWRGRRNRAGGEARGPSRSVAPTEPRLSATAARAAPSPAASTPRTADTKPGTARRWPRRTSPRSPPSSGATTRAGRSRRSAMPLTRPPRTSAPPVGTPRTATASSRPRTRC